MFRSWCGDRRCLSPHCVLSWLLKFWTSAFGLALVFGCLWLLWLETYSDGGMIGLLKRSHVTEGHRKPDDLIDESKRREGDNSTAVLDFQQRKALYEKICQDRQPGSVAPLSIYPPSNLTVCPTPKVGCTFWRRAFLFLYKDFAGQTDVKSMFDIDRYHVHYGRHSTFKTYSFNSDEGRRLADASLKVQFTRDPYQRLWSDYVDKFLLPDSWSDYGVVILKLREGNTKLCSDDIQFEEFLAFVLIDNNAHWRPVTEVCDPCAFKPDIVGKMETFSRDVNYILADRGLSYLTEGRNYSSHVEDEMKILTDYIFCIYRDRKIVRDCLTIGQMSARLWRVFQLNGYIRMDQPFPEPEIESAIKDKDLSEAREIVIKSFITEYQKHPTTKDDWKRQRNDVINDAYSNVSKEMKDKIRDRFKLDFIMFEYDPTPPGS